MKLRKISAALIGWPSAMLLGLSATGMFIAPHLAVWPLGVALIGITTAVVVSSKTLRERMAHGARRLLAKNRAD